MVCIVGASLESEPDLAVVAKPPSSERALLVLSVGCGCGAPAIVRAAFREIKELGAVRDDAVLVASELVTNAVVHSGGSPADTIQIRAVLVRGGVSISVHDPGLSGDAPHLRDTDVMQAGGRGLRIVERLARRWGCERDPGHRVWAELATGRGQ
jgi:anti-sigma regulatory factor (Ser/Thr protein kinase)